METILAALMPLVWLQGSFGNSGLPHPWLIQDRSTMALTLECNPPFECNLPPQSSAQYAVLSLRLFAYNPERMTYSTLPYITSAMKGSPKRGDDVPEIAKVNFTGSWDMMNGTPSLSLVMPITKKQFGIYYCVVEHKVNQQSTPENVSTRFPVNESNFALGTITKNNCKVRLTKSHKIEVTWNPADIQSKFIEASVSRTCGNTASQPLFRVTDTKDSVHDQTETLLAQFKDGSGKQTNSTMEVYVSIPTSSPYCRYSCHVSYERCKGQNAHYCDCNEEHVQIAPVTEIQPGERTNVGWRISTIVLIVVVILLIVFIIVSVKFSRPFIEYTTHRASARDLRYRNIVYRTWCLRPDANLEEEMDNLTGNTSDAGTESGRNSDSRQNTQTTGTQTERDSDGRQNTQTTDTQAERDSDGRQSTQPTGAQSRSSTTSETEDWNHLSGITSDISAQTVGHSENPTQSSEEISDFRINAR